MDESIAFTPGPGRTPPAMADEDPGEIFSLSAWEKLYIIAGCGGILVVCFIIMTCILTKCCGLYNACFRDKSRQQADGTSGYGSTASQESPSGKKARSFRDRDRTDHSDSSSSEYIELPYIKKSLKGKKGRDGKTKGPVDVEYPYRGGSLDFGIKYAPDDKKLIIRIMEAKNLQTFKDHECMDHFVKIRLYRIPKQFFRFKGTQKRQHMLINNLDSEYQTKIKRKAVNPVFNETFELRIDPKEMENFCIKFQLCDFDKYARQIVSGEVFLILQSIDFSAQQELLFSKPLEQATEEELGEIFISLCYLPTAEKMSVTIVKAKGLKVMDSKRNATDPYVKIALMYDGRQMKRQKTTVRHGETSPLWAEQFVFDVPYRQLDKVYYNISVVHEDKGKNGGLLMGRVYLGMNFDESGTSHWWEMIRNPRKQLACWHRIQEC